MTISLLSIISFTLSFINAKRHDYNHLFEERIVNGQPISASNYPWMVSVRDINFTNNISNPHFCGASLIEVDPYPVILTAAHCVEDLILNETTGSIYSITGNKLWPTLIALDLNRTIQQRHIEYWYPSMMNDDTQYNTLYVYDANMIYIHPKYNKTANGIFDGYDIALFIIDDNQTVDIDIDPLPTIPMQLNSLEQCCTSGQNLIQIGYGNNATDGSLTQSLESTLLSYIDGIECIDTFKLAGNTSTFLQPLVSRYPEEIPTKLLCAIGNNTDPCQGDSGGPLFSVNNDDGSIEIVGIVSFGEGCAAGYPGFWTSTGHFYDWLYNQINGEPTTTTTDCDGEYKVATDCPDACDDDSVCRQCQDEDEDGEEICIDAICEIVFEDCECKEIFKNEDGVILEECDIPTADDCVSLMMKTTFITMIISLVWT